MNKHTNLKKQAEPQEATIHGLSHDGRGIASINQLTTFVAGALPTEIVHYKVLQKHRHYHDAEATDIIQTSSERADPPCPHFGTCGGCSLQHMSNTLQIALKQQTLLEQLKHFGKVIPDEILPPLSHHTLGYRRKARLGVKYVIKKEKLLVGFREKSSRYLADLTQCLTLHPKVGKQLHEIGHVIASLITFCHIPQVEVAIGDEEAALIFRHMVDLPETDKEKLIAFGKQYGFHIYTQPNPPHPIEKCWPLDDHHRLQYSLPDHQLRFMFHPLDFTQINLEVNRLMVNQALAELDLQPHETALDLFCGIGNFSLPMARLCHQVTGIEGSHEMVTRAQDNAQLNDIQNTQFYAANLTDEALQASWTKQTYDKVLLDPPRAGAKEILSLLHRFQPKRVVYVSCNPATLARDAGELVHQHHYQLKKVGILNMFPHTAHIEAMAVFEKNE